LALLPSYAPNNPENLVFPTASGKLRQQGKPFGKSGTLRGYYRAAGIALRPHLHFHALRHTFASNLISGALGRQWSMQEVQVLMGHSSIMVTQRYAHLGEDAIAIAVRETVEAQAKPAPTVPVPVVVTALAAVEQPAEPAFQAPRSGLLARVAGRIAGLVRKGHELPC
jgi:hypothetical protein